MCVAVLRGAQTTIHFTILQIGDQVMAALPENARCPPASTMRTTETQEWQDTLSSVIEREDAERAALLIEGLMAQARQAGSISRTAPPPV